MSIQIANEVIIEFRQSQKKIHTQTKAERQKAQTNKQPSENKTKQKNINQQEKKEPAKIFN